MIETDEAIVLAGGFGTRLRGTVDAVPKSLALVAGRPFLAWLLDNVAAKGMRRVILATGYLGEQIEAAFGATWRGMALIHSREPLPLGTGGAIALALKSIDGEACLVLNGDTWLELDYAAFERTVIDAGARLGVGLANVPDVARYGAIRVEDDRLAGFDEKGSLGPGLINAGVYWMRRSLLKGYPTDEAFSFEREVLIPAVSREPVIGYTDTHGFIDIGTPEDYARAQTVFGRERVHLE